METRQELVCDAIKLEVSCTFPDCSGFIGYNFVVSPDENIEEMNIFLKKTIEDAGGKYGGMYHYVVKDFFVKNLRSRDDIFVKVNDL